MEVEKYEGYRWNCKESLLYGKFLETTRLKFGERMPNRYLNEVTGREAFCAEYRLAFFSSLHLFPYWRVWNTLIPKLMSRRSPAILLMLFVKWSHGKRLTSIFEKLPYFFGLTKHRVPHYRVTTTISRESKMHHWLNRLDRSFTLSIWFLINTFWEKALKQSFHVTLLDTLATDNIDPDVRIVSIF